MDVLFNTNASGLFASLSGQTAQVEYMAQQTMVRGLDAYDKEDYDKALLEYRRATSMAPNSTVAANAYKLMAQAYSKQNDADAAIESYQKALRINPRDVDALSSLGNTYHFLERYDDAVKTYAEAVQIDPSAANRYALAQGYLSNGQYDDARYQFTRIRDMAPQSPQGEYGLGLVYEKQGEMEKAIKAFDRALDIKPDFLDAKLEKGYVYADNGLIEEANAVLADLKKSDESRAALLEGHIYTRTPPKLVLALSPDFNLQSKGPGTKLTALSPDFYVAGASHTFSMSFLFNKEMDAKSVENLLNWKIDRAPYNNPDLGYNFGGGVKSTEASLPPYPLSVSYDEKARIATVFFKLTQDSSLTATLDPGHVRFSFKGEDTFGNAMDSKADQYTGFNGFA